LVGVALGIVAAALLGVPALAQPPASPAPSVSPAVSPPPGLPAPKLQAVETAINVAMHRYGIPGLSAAVASGDSVRLSAGYGLADVENAVPAGPLTVYRLASVSKPITAVAVLQLAAKGKLDLDAPIQRYVPAYPEKQWPLNCRQLLCHQAGVRQWTEDEFRNTTHYAGLAESLEFFKNDPLAFEPGTRTLYTSLGYNLLGAAVESAAGQGYLEYLRENVFIPAGMETAGIDDVFALIPHRAAGYQKGPGGELFNSGLSDTSNRVPGGGLVSTAEDVARFAVALHSGALMKKETREQMFVRQRTRDGKLSGYGLGWAVGTERGRREIYHIGGQPKVSTVLYMLPDTGLSVVLLANLEGVGGPLLEVARQLAEITAR
jgi:serine beta-lactamase-like protein LACTB, mitochondrial